MVEILKNEAEYRAYPALNYSTLKKVVGDPSELLEEQKTTSALGLGSAVDTLLFDGEEKFGEKFYSFNASKPTASSGELAEAYIEVVKQTKMVGRDSSLALKLAREKGLWSTSKDATVIAKFTESFWMYIEAVIEAGDQIILDAETLSKVGQMVDTLKTHELTSKFYDKSREGVEVLYQVPLVFEYEEVKMKAMLDSIVINHNEKWIEPIDTKTMEEHPLKFMKNVLRYRYDIQVSIYKAAVERFRDVHFPEYNLKLFKFSVISQARMEAPYVYRMNATTWRQKMNAVRVVPLEGLSSLLNRFKWHSENQLFEYPKEMYDRGSIEL